MRKIYALIISSILAIWVVSFVLFQPSRAWQTITTFSGDEGIQIQTQTFSVPSYTWRICWNLTQKEVGDVMLSVEIYDRNVDISDPKSSGGSFSYSSFPDSLRYPENRSKSGMYEVEELWEWSVGREDLYLEISAVGCTWTIAVEALS